MLSGKLRSDPHDRLRTEGCCVSKRLSKVVVICPVKLVLDDHIAAGSRVAGENVGCKRPDSYFRVFDLKLKSDRLAKSFDVVWMSKPRREVRRFVGPHSASLNGSKSSQGRFVH